MLLGIFTSFDIFQSLSCMLSYCNPPLFIIFEHMGRKQIASPWAEHLAVFMNISQIWCLPSPVSAADYTSRLMISLQHGQKSIEPRIISELLCLQTMLQEGRRVRKWMFAHWNYIPPFLTVTAIHPQKKEKNKWIWLWTISCTARNLQAAAEPWATAHFIQHHHNSNQCISEYIM